MLGCQDFCGYYDWTFHHVRQRYGQPAVRDLWRRAIGDEAQRHYIEAAMRDGLRGLLEVWTKTGEDEGCDWMFTLDEGRNVLRWDMRQCPSKGFLLANDLNADEDYCDHCMGWIAPLLERAGIEVAVHEHNHCGQCWAEMRVKGKAYQPLELAGDIRKDPRWQRGYVDRFAGGVKTAALPEVADEADPCEVLRRWYAKAEHVLVVGGDGKAQQDRAARTPAAGSYDALLVTDAAYVAGTARDLFAGEPLGVLIGDRPTNLSQLAERFLGTPPQRRPLLMHAYLPGVEPLSFAAFGLPRPVPILPQLIRAGLYAHQPGRPTPATGVFLVMLAVSLGKRVSGVGIDLPASRR